MPTAHFEVHELDSELDAALLEAKIQAENPMCDVECITKVIAVITVSRSEPSQDF